MEIKARVRGITQHVRWNAALSDGIHDAARKGVLEAAEYLRDRIMEKFGVYQPTGGPGGGAWPKLASSTIWKKMKKWGIKGKPLIASGAMKSSIKTRMSPNLKTLAGYVYSDDPKLAFHVQPDGPVGRIPKRDPFLVTVIEERDVCTQIIEDAVDRAIDWRR